MLTPNPLVPDVPDTPELASPLSFGPARPTMLFPVRLETRFVFPPEGGAELRVRVYPDTVHVDTHERDLTADELTWGQHFWEQTWRASTDAERAKAAWRQLADRFDPPRAAWIARALRPLNPGERPRTPLPADAALPHAVRFPSVATKTEAWTRAPRTRVLPNVWHLLGYRDGRLVINARGNPIPEVLATGPDPGAVPPNAADDDPLVVDEGMRWMIDFDAAERVGMGIRVKLTVDEGASGVDFLLALGIRDSLVASVDWAPHLAELFDAHHYTAGLGFVLHGTPSNNTAEAPSGFSSSDPGHETSYLAERAAQPVAPGDGSNADLLTAACGFGTAGQVFDALPHAAVREHADARHMNAALWQATLGYFLLQMLGVGETSESPLTDDDIAWVRRHFIDYVRASGPLPAIRVGKQPYGILPVTSLTAWKPRAGEEAQDARDTVLRDWLVRLRELWRHSYHRIPRLGRTADSGEGSGLERDLAEVLGMDALSSSYSVRNLLGRHYLEHLVVFLSAEVLADSWQLHLDGLSREQALLLLRIRRRKELAMAGWWDLQGTLAGAVLQTLGVAWRPRVARGVFLPPAATLRGALVQEGQGTTLTPNYLESLLGARDLEAIRREAVLQPAPRALLYKLLRHSMLLEYAAAASRLLINRGMFEAPWRREPELVDLGILWAPTEELMQQTVWRQMFTKITVPGAAEPLELRTYLLGLSESGEPDVEKEPDLRPLSEFRSSLAHLKSLSPARLEQVMTGTLDLCSHRLDAWITSIATKRLADMRRRDPSGILIGGYGWVMNLKPTARANVAPPPGEAAPIYHSAGDPGFVHTPSLTHAATVAVLRSGHLAHSGNQAAHDLLAIDLSSERVRLATWLLDGVRQGQPLGALLGYRFERHLQDTRKAHLIAFFREVAPLVARKREGTNPPDEKRPVEAIAANNVVDGLALLRRWQTGKRANPPQWNRDTIPFDNRVTAQAAQEALALLEDAVDAVSDALLAENVYHAVRGNPLRAASTVESIAGGETPPPELEVVRTPRTGVALTHRVVTLFSGEPVLSPGWPPGNAFRANAEPHLNAWGSKLLVSPANVRCIVDRLDPGSGAVVESRELRLNQLRLAPLDFIYAVEAGADGQQGEIEQRILYTIMRKSDGFPPGSLLRVNPNRGAGWAPGDVSYGEFTELVRTARRLLTNGRAVGGADLTPPERSTSFSMDVAELDARAAGAEQWLRRTATDIQAQLAARQPATLDVLRDLILRSASFGVAGAVPRSAAGDSAADREVLVAQSIAVLNELRQRVEQLTTLSAGFTGGTATAEARRDHAIGRLRLVFGKGFVVLPRFSAANVEELEKALANSVAVQGGDPFASMTWFQRVARVRDGVGHLSAVLTYSEALEAGERLRLSIAQLPYAANDRWVGLPLGPDQHVPGGKLSLVVQSTQPVNVRQALAGLLIDEWVEVVPNANETTGIAFQYDGPNAAPPQTILLAVPPQLETPWTVWSLQQVLLETLDLARVRAVDTDALDELGHYLPALYFAWNTAGDTVSTDFTTLT